MASFSHPCQCSPPSAVTSCCCGAGGKRNLGEDVVSCAQRECMEEIGVDITPFHVLGYLSDMATTSTLVVSPSLTLPVDGSCDILRVSLSAGEAFGRGVKKIKE